MNPRTRAGTAMVLLLSQAAVGSAALLARIGLDSGVTPLALAAWRLTLASAALLGLAALRRVGPQRHPVDPPAAAALLMAGACLGLHFAAWIASLQYVSVARSTLLVSTTPIWAAVGGAVFLRQRPSAGFWIGLLLALPGAWLITAPGGAPSRDAARGAALAVLGAAAIAAYLLLVTGPQLRLGTRRTVTWTYSAAAAALWLAVAVQRSALHAPSARGWLSIVGMAAVPQLVGHTAINWCLTVLPAAVVAQATLLDPVFASLLAWWILGEPLTPRQGAGALLLLAGVSLALWGRTALTGSDWTDSGAPDAEA